MMMLVGAGDDRSDEFGRTRYARTRRSTSPIFLALVILTNKPVILYLFLLAMSVCCCKLFSPLLLALDRCYFLGNCQVRVLARIERSGLAVVLEDRGWKGCIGARMSGLRRDQEGFCGR